MSWTAYSRDFVPLADDPAPSHGGERSLLRRVLDAVYESRRKKAELEIARFLDRRGARITDENERQMTQHLLGGHWRAWDR